MERCFEAAMRGRILDAVEQLAGKSFPQMAVAKLPAGVDEEYLANSWREETMVTAYHERGILA